MAHVRIDPEVTKVIKSLVTPNGLYPTFAGRSIAETVNSLVRQSADFKAAEAQMTSENHRKPGGKR